ncbi:hypothetical protein SRABI36_02545 [Pedobacter sp. Bi36]|nr:hypothetical protein SRABI126_00137 [Pedobacter sp. Bi126]CAH0223690.1 hypothetical protein SRABI36_02545 [Pedobacter sp. Bi36]
MLIKFHSQLITQTLSNISGRMTSINNSSLTINDKNDDGNDLFGMEIGYELPDAGLGVAVYYNGLISSVKWSTETSVVIDLTMIVHSA